MIRAKWNGEPNQNHTLVKKKMAELKENGGAKRTAKVSGNSKFDTFLKKQ